MRIITIALLLAASAAVPAAARDRQDHNSNRADYTRHDDRGGRPNGNDKAKTDRRPTATRGWQEQRPTVAVDSRGHNTGWNGGPNGPGRPDVQPNGRPHDDRAGNGRPGGQWQGRPGTDRPNGNWTGRPGANRPNGNWNNRPGDNRSNGNWNNRPGHGWTGRPNGGWNNGWRNDSRYDWQRYRASNRWLYRSGPRFYAPRGFRYYQWQPGYRVDPYFYGERYWLTDPWRYRLPPAYGEYRWVRYYNDAALVDIRTGLVADVIFSFFL